MTQFETKRRAAKLTQREVASKLGITHVAVGQWDRGRATPNVKHVRKLAKLLKMKTDDVVRLFDAEPVGAA